MTPRISEALDEIAAVRAEMSEAFGDILTMAEVSLAHRPGHSEMDARLRNIILACRAEDICGQRLGNAQRMLRGETPDALLRGPALAGAGLDQNAADALFAANETQPLR
jgi:hypothetical protein